MDSGLQELDSGFLEGRVNTRQQILLLLLNLGLIPKSYAPRKFTNISHSKQGEIVKRKTKFFNTKF